jgi:hypothetical protein
MDENKTEVITSYRQIPYSIIGLELQGATKTAFTEELNKIFELYEIYKKGSDFTTEGANGDYVPAKLKYKKIKSLIDKEARFLFSKSPDFNLSVPLKDGKLDKEASSTLQTLVDEVLKSNMFQGKLLKAAKDCFIGKRAACMLNFNPNSGITISFMSALEFYYEMDDINPDILSKFIAFIRVHDSSSTGEVRIFKKKYWMQDGTCYVEEILYDGHGIKVEDVTPEQPTRFTYIPAVVILNDGLTGDLLGESEVEQLNDYEAWYSKMANSDKDAERKSMNPTKYAIDCDNQSTKSLSSAAGSFWDLTSDENQSADRQGKVGVLEANMTYKDALKVTLDRINEMMHEQVDVPNVSSEALQGVVTSGKTLKAIYWSLIVRCDEKMLVWRPALEFIGRTIINGSILYPESAEYYVEEATPEVLFTIDVENNYPLPEDEAEEKTIDMSEVLSLTMSKKSYMKKWRKLTDEEADEEIKQIQKEKQILEDSFSNIPPTGNKVFGDND